MFHQLVMLMCIWTSSVGVVFLFLSKGRTIVDSFLQTSRSRFGVCDCGTYSASWVALSLLWLDMTFLFVSRVCAAYLQTGWCDKGVLLSCFSLLNLPFPSALTNHYLLYVFLWGISTHIQIYCWGGYPRDAISSHLAYLTQQYSFAHICNGCVCHISYIQL